MMLTKRLATRALPLRTPLPRPAPQRSPRHASPPLATRRSTAPIWGRLILLTRWCRIKGTYSRSLSAAAPQMPRRRRRGERRSEGVRLQRGNKVVGMGDGKLTKKERPLRTPPHQLLPHRPRQFALAMHRTIWPTSNRVMLGTMQPSSVTSCLWRSGGWRTPLSTSGRAFWPFATEERGRRG